MNFEDIIKNKTDKLTSSVTNALKMHSKYKLYFSNDKHENKTIDVFASDDGKKKILSVKYEILGTYHINSKLFTWSCDQLLTDKKMTILSKKIKEYSKNLKKVITIKKFKDVEYQERLYYYSTNNIFFVEYVNISDILKFSIFVSECHGILNFSENNGFQTYYLITDIISF